LIILCRVDIHYYEGYVLSTDDDIEDFFTAFNLSSDQTNKLIEKTSLYSPEEALKTLFDNFIKGISIFPATEIMAAFARETYIKAFSVKDSTILSNPDNILLKWIASEYELFKAFEIKLYGERINKPFSSVEELIVFSNKILNRRKSRAGKSLEHHLSEIFLKSGLQFEQQVITEDSKKPDFIFPGSQDYHSSNFPIDNLIFLGAKTTCKDRWRQILNEADRIAVKHLFTLQQGISKNQLAEMYKNDVCLVVPQPYLDSFDKSFREKILTLKQFVSLVSYKQK
jgi:type II restriction enzyme